MAMRAVDPEVLNAYGLGTFYMQDYTEDAMNRAVQAFDHCIAMQPRNSEALRWKNKVQQLATAC